MGNINEVQSHPIIDVLGDSYCCLECRTLADPFVGCVCRQKELEESLKKDGFRPNARKINLSEWGEGI